jgi:hypothetical protein
MTLEFSAHRLLFVIDHPDDISVEELHDALNNAEGKKPPQRLLAAIAYKTASHRPNLLSDTTLADEQSTVGSSGSTLTSRLSRLLLMLTGLGESERYQRNNKKSKKRSTNLPKKLG